MLFRRLSCTLQLVFFSLVPTAAGESASRGSLDATHCAPADIGSIDRFLDSKGGFSVIFRDCLSPAAPFVLFRLKRQGYSRCAAQATPEGLRVQGRR